MGFLNPLGFFLTPLLGVIVLLYLLKLKRRDVEVPASFLWRQTLIDFQANTVFQRLRKNLLLFIQLFILTLLILAAARLWIKGEGPQGQWVVMIIDNTASMQATDVLPSRLAEAKRRALRLINTLPVETRLAILESSKQARVLAPFTNQKPALRRLVESLSPKEAEGRLEEALTLARGLLESRPQAEIIVISDGNTPIPREFKPFAFRSEIIGTPQPANVAITTFEVRKKDSRMAEALTIIRNFSSRPARVGIEWQLEGHVLNASDVILDPQEAKSLMTPVPFRAGGLIHARLTRPDDLALDNDAWDTFDSRAEPRVLLVSQGDLFLERALVLIPGIQPLKVSPQQYHPRLAEEVDVFIFDQWAPPTPPLKPSWFIGMVPSTLLTLGPPASQPSITAWDQEHPVLQFADFSSVHLASVKPIQGLYQVLVDTDKGPWLAEFSTPFFSHLLLTVPLEESDWPLRVSFPVVMANAIEWLMLSSRVALERALSPGDPLHLSFSGKVTIQRPDGKKSQTIGASTRPGEHLFMDTWRLGAYTIKQGSKIERSIVKLPTTQEMDLAPLSAPSSSHTQASSPVIAPPSGLPSLQDLWPTLVAFALFFLGLEWCIYHRRIDIAL